MVPIRVRDLVVVHVLKTIKCPYCGDGQSVRLSFATDTRWLDCASTNPFSLDFLCEIYVCPQCGRVSLLDAPKETKYGEKEKE